MKLPPALNIVVGEWLLHLADALIRRKSALFGSTRNLIFARHAPRLENIHAIRHGLELLLKSPASRDFQIHDIELRVGAVQSEK